MKWYPSFIAALGLFFFALLAVAVIGAAVVNAACSFGGVDYAGLTKAAGSGDYNGADAEYKYTMNVCGASNKACMDNTGVAQAVCQFDPQGATVAGLGRFDDTTTQPAWAALGGGGAQYTFTNGDKCWSATGMLTRTVNVQLPCGNEAATFTIAEVKSTCTFTIVLPTPKSCPGGSPPGASGTSGGTIFLIILVVCIPLYIGIGCIYKRKKLGTNGNESCPNYDFWKQIPGYVKDGFRFTMSGCKKGGTYNQL